MRFLISTMAHRRSGSSGPCFAGRAGVSVRDVTSAVDVFNDGANVIQIPIAGELIDLVVAGKDASKLTAAELGDIPVVTRSGSVLKLGQLAKIEIIQRTTADQADQRQAGDFATASALRPCLWKRLWKSSKHS